MSAEGPKKRDLSALEEIAEDVIGFNFRSLRTFGDLLFRTNRVFRTYADREADIYTPALRLWLGLLVILTILTFLFGGNADLLLRVMSNWPEAQREALLASIDGTVEDLAAEYDTAYTFLQPVSILLVSCLSVFLIATFRRHLSWVARINLTFAVLTVGSMMGLAVFPILVSRPDLGLLALLPVWAAYWGTFFRGSKDVLATTMTGRIVKATVFSTALLVLVFAAGVLTYIMSFSHAVSALQAAS